MVYSDWLSQDRDMDWDRDMDEQVVQFYVEPFTLHLNRDRDWHLLFWFQPRPLYRTQQVWLHH